MYGLLMRVVSATQEFNEGCHKCHIKKKRETPLLDRAVTIMITVMDRRGTMPSGNARRRR